MNHSKYCSQIKAWSKKFTDNLKIWPPFQNLRQSCMQSALKHWMKHTREQYSKKKFKYMHWANNWTWGDETGNEPEKGVKQSRCAKFLHNFHVFASENVYKTLILLKQSHQTLRLDSEQKARHWHSNLARGLKGNIIKHSTPSKSNSETATCLVLTGLTEGRSWCLEVRAGVWKSEQSDCPSSSSNSFSGVHAITESEPDA